MTISTRPNDDVRNAPARSVSSSGEPGGAPSPSPPLQSDLAGDDFAAIVRDLATQSSSQTDFLGRLAAELLSEFSIATVALSHHRLSSPIVLAAAPGPPDGLDDRRLTQLLARATSSATACDVPLRRKSDSSADRLPTTGTEPRTRGLHIMLNEKSGDRGSCALLLVYAVDAVPDPITQIRDLHEEHGWGYRRIAKHLGLAWYTVAKIGKYQRRASFPTRWERVPEAQDGPAA